MVCDILLIAKLKGSLVVAKKDLNKNLHQAKTNKEDEFYTQLSDIEKELKHYKKHFKNKVVYCNCDDPRVSNFFHYFSYNFEKLGLKKLITTCYKSQDIDLFSQDKSKQAIYLEYNGDKNGNNLPDLEEIGIYHLKGDGDFRSEESVELLKQADIVVTNPPFSLFRAYAEQLIKYNKEFLIIGNINAITYKESFKLIKENRMWLGYNTVRHFSRPDGSMYETARTFWFTNLAISKRNEDLILYKNYNKEECPKYLNYDAIEVSKTANIPIDYSGAMGVPITFLNKYNPDQFEIIGLANDKREIDDAFVQGEVTYLDDKHKKFVGMVLKEGNVLRATYARIIIRNKKL